ncbi:MAG: SpoIIE family protein phosphatase [Bdellovibrionales bacterium]|nr:SpoIIE family protein phosphatase [Bdellovibrionales bacterium]
MSPTNQKQLIHNKPSLVIKKREVRKIRISLRYKILLLLTLIPLITLALYLRLAIDLFEKDKIAYVYDSGVTLTRSLAMQFKSEIDFFLNTARPIVEGFNSKDAALVAQKQKLLEAFPQLGALILLQYESNSGYQKVMELISPWASGIQQIRDINFIKRIQIRAQQNEFFIISGDPNTSSLFMVSRMGSSQTSPHWVLIGLYRASHFLHAFSQGTLYQNFLIDSIDTMDLTTGKNNKNILEGENLKSFFEPVRKGQLPESSFELVSSRKKKTLVSYAEVGVGGLKVASVVERNKVTKAVDILIVKSMIFFLALLSLTALVSIFASTQLTATLSDLYNATKKIASGHFNVRVQTRSNDEVGGLADGFNAMAAEVSRLMKDTAQKARMESELNTVRTVQETLFPNPLGHFDQIKIAGYFEPASECGGDWWNYSLIGENVLLCIGDATGHGAPAALITSAARSAAAVIELLGGVKPHQALEIMNYAIHETSKGKINMTFFLALIHKNTGKMVYANASHDPPYLVKKSREGKLSKKNLIPLMEANGARLGEKSNSTYQQTEIQLDPGDCLVFYTDGIIDIQDPQGQRWGERAFLKTLTSSLGNSEKLESKLALIKKNIVGYRGDAQLIDDVTLFMAEFKDVA